MLTHHSSKRQQHRLILKQQQLIDLNTVSAYDVRFQIRGMNQTLYVY